MTQSPKHPDGSDSRIFRLLREAERVCAPAPGELSEGEAALRRGTLRAVLRGGWLDVIEETLPYVERCVEEQRRFIQAHGEIVRVDQARKVDPESIRHLAQHSDFISRVKPDGDVLPKQLMIIQREDSYAIYENRFLFTLVHQLRRFLDARWQEYLRLEGCTETKIDWSRFQIDEDSELTVQLRHALRRSRPETAPRDSAGRRLLRLRTSVEGLTLSPLMKLLTGVAPVSPPVVRTNVMKKNVNFQHALALYEDLSKMEPPFFTETADQPAAEESVPETLQSALDALTRLQRSAMGLLAAEENAQTLRQRVEAEDQRTEAERLAREEARKREVEARIEAARQQEIELRRREAAQWEARVEALSTEKEALLHELERQRLEADQRLAAAMERGRLQAEALQARLRALQGEKDAETERLRQEQAANEQTRKESESKLAEQRAQAEERLTALKADTEARLLAEQKEMRKQTERMQKKCLADLSEQRKREAVRLRQQNDAHQKELRQLRKTLEEAYVQRQRKAAQSHARQQKSWQLKLDRAQRKSAKE